MTGSSKLFVGITTLCAEATQVIALRFGEPTVAIRSGRAGALNARAAISARPYAETTKADDRSLIGQIEPFVECNEHK